MSTFDKISFTIQATVACVGALIIGAYVVFGGPAEITYPKKLKRHKGFISGLTNIGNTCFVNALIQALASCPSFYAWLESLDKVNTSLSRSLNRLLFEINNPTRSGGSSCARSVLNCLCAHGWVISPEEQDVLEFFHVLFCTLADEPTNSNDMPSLLDVSWVSKESELCNEKVTVEDSSHDLDGNNSGMLEKHIFDEDVVMVNKEVKDEEGQMHFETITLSPSKRKIELHSKDASVQQKSALHKGAVITKCRSGFNKLSDVEFLTKDINENPFKGFLASQLQCTVCQYKSPVQWSSFENVSLSLPSCILNSVDLSDLLYTYICEEQVSDVVCDGCSHGAPASVRRNFIKQLTFGKTPECLCIHIHRLFWLDNGTAMKRHEHVIFPEVLSLLPYTYTTSLCGKKSDGSEAGKLFDLLSYMNSSENNESGCTSVDCDDHTKYKATDRPYELRAVIVHLGDAVSGHFVTYRLGPFSESSSRRWFYTSDLIVKEVNVEDVLKANAYMLLYEKTK